MTRDCSRRRVLCSLGFVGVTAFAGCTTDEAGGADEPNETTDSNGDTESSTSATATGADATTSSATATTTAPLDLREANVVAVEHSKAGSSADGTDYRFSVTLYHDDDGEEGYANWWQVETRSGEQLGRRKLLHAHGTREFTRSETITIPDGVSCVAVRGHDQTHGYGGRAALVAVDSGDVRFVEQGSEPSSFADVEC
jgi:hypothetical protein